MREAQRILDLVALGDKAPPEPETRQTAARSLLLALSVQDPAAVVRAATWSNIDRDRFLLALSEWFPLPPSRLSIDSSLFKAIGCVRDEGKTRSPTELVKMLLADEPRAAAQLTVEVDRTISILDALALR